MSTYRNGSIPLHHQEVKYKDYGIPTPTKGTTRRSTTREV